MKEESVGFSDGQDMSREKRRQRGRGETAMVSNLSLWGNNHCREREIPGR